MPEHVSLPRIWAVIGGKGSGKDTAVRYLMSRLGGSYFSAGDWLRDHAARFGDPGLQVWEVAAQLERERGPEHLVDAALELRERPLFISGLRYLAPIARVRREGGFVLCIKADLETRHARVIDRRRPGEAIAPVWVAGASKRVDAGGPTRERLDAEADRVISNDGTLEEFHRQLDRLVDDLRAGSAVYGAAAKG